jgi:hypothetical protein
MKMFEAEINTNNPNNVVSNLALYLARISSLEADSNATITPARNSQALFCGAKYSVVPRFEILFKASIGSKRLKDRIANIPKKKIGGIKFPFLIFL